MKILRHGWNVRYGNNKNIYERIYKHLWLLQVRHTKYPLLLLLFHKLCSQPLQYFQGLGRETKVPKLPCRKPETISVSPLGKN